ncbi:hypothetical protein [Terricaulis silvestris]|uniref:Uncharacterized protein n=1 Tax=Terricaulis silvestris TaxID=2686094 RepID=A0A6I6MMQ9_9CAUL|nr:hypothetical protein [Terricaulis silvestris]QGZ95331.1 hypothetical protein DSM104635_02180 [Terricaulis silvestris]
MRVAIFGRVAAAAILAIGLAACSSGRTADTRRGVGDAAYIPLRDVGLMRPEIPLLLRNLQYPYSTATLADCHAVTREIAALDGVLGPESYQPGPNRNVWDRSGDFVEEQAISAAESTAQDLIPFRSWVRRISGASRAERDALRAVANGQQRRTFLRGYGASLGCPGMIPPPPPNVARQR